MLMVRLKADKELTSVMFPGE